MAVKAEFLGAARSHRTASGARSALAIVTRVRHGFARWLQAGQLGDDGRGAVRSTGARI